MVGANSTAEGPSWAPWHVLLHWTPFKIDALGLVTLLGAEEINAAVGRLVSSAYLEYLPLLGAYVIAGDRFTEKVAGWNLYNISQGIHTTDLAAWLTRWMLSQDFETTRSYVVWKVTPPRSRSSDIFISVLIGFVLNGYLIAGTIISADWYGFANALVMVVSVFVRVYVIGQQRLAVDAMIDKAVTNISPPLKDSYEAQRHEYKKWKREQKEHKHAEMRHRKSSVKASSQEGHSSHSDLSTPSNGQKELTQHVQLTDPPTKPNPKDYANEGWIGKQIKVLIIQSDSKAVTFEMPNELVMPRSLFIEGPKILNPKTYFVMRSIGWIAFAVHIVAIGMADLATQLYTVVLIVLPTLLLVKKTGCDDSEWKATFSSWKASVFHSRSQVSPAGKPQVADDSGKAAQLHKVRECWIGSRLKAEVYEWPESYEFHEEGEGDDRKWFSGPSPTVRERSTKRQDLYAWLALSNDEEESMDKWDLFPHIRNDNHSWWKTYKHKKHALIGKSIPGLPQHVEESATKLPESSKPNRTATINFVQTPDQERNSPAPKPAPRQSSSGAAGSSAFPAISAHDQEMTQGVPGTATQPADVDTGTGLPRINTQPSTTESSHISYSAGITQSPTVISATDAQP